MHVMLAVMITDKLGVVGGKDSKPGGGEEKQPQLSPTLRMTNMVMKTHL